MADARSLAPCPTSCSSCLIAYWAPGFAAGVLDSAAVDTPSSNSRGLTAPAPARVSSPLYVAMYIRPPGVKYRRFVSNGRKLHGATSAARSTEVTGPSFLSDKAAWKLPGRQANKIYTQQFSLYTLSTQAAGAGIAGDSRQVTDGMKGPLVVVCL